MSVLSDKDIKEYIKSGRLKIMPFNEENVKAAGIDLSLGNEFRIFKHSKVKFIDTKIGISEELTELIKIKENEPFIIHSGEFALATTKEYLKIPADLVGRIDGRSSLARLGILIHSTSGTINPGWEGKLTLEIANVSKVPILLWPGMKICAVSFETLSSACEKPYNKQKDAKYNKQKGPTISQIHKDNL